MADKAIGELERAPQISEDSLIPIEEQGKAMAMSGKQFADFAREAAAADVQRAIDAAADAEGNANAAKTDADRAEAARESIVLDEQKIEQAVENASTSAANAAESEAKAKEYMEQAGEIAGGDFVTNTRFESHASRHAKNGEDPLTLDMIGAAPSGFGLGKDATEKVVTTMAELDAIRVNGWCYYNGGVAIADDIKTAIVRTDTSGRTISQTAYPYRGTAAYINCVLRRNLQDRLSNDENVKSWCEWEWENPPMKLGVEYRTTERYNGKPVYVKVISFGGLPNNSSKEVNHDIDFTSLISDYAFAKSGTSVTSLRNYPGVTACYTGAAKCYITTTQDWTLWDECYFVLKYTKN